MLPRIFCLFEARMSDAIWCVLKSCCKSPLQTYSWLTSLLAQRARRNNIPHVTGLKGMDYGMGKSTGSDGSAVNMHRAL
jgi:hypothetical protein